MRRRSIAREVVCLGWIVATAAGCGGGDEQLVNTATGTAVGPVSWTKVLGGQLAQSGWLVATSKTGQIIVAGTMQGRANFAEAGEIDTVSDSDIFIAWINRDGKVARVRRFGETGEHVPTGLAVDSAGGVVLAGIAVGSINFGGGTIDSQDADGFVAAFGPDGEYRFSVKATGAGGQTSGQLALADDGSILLSGTFQGDIDIGGKTLTSAGETDLFVAKISAAGSTIWARAFGDARTEADASLALGPQGQVFVSGFYQGAPDLGDGPLPDTGATADGQLLAALDTDGNLSWSRGVVHQFGYFAFGVQVDEAGSPWLVGPCAGEVDLFGTKIAASTQGIAIAKLHVTGEPLSTQVFEAESPGYVQAAQARGGGIVIAGDFEDTIDIGGRTLTSAGQSDLFLVWLDSEGRITRQERTGGAGTERIGSVSMLPTGQVVVTGSFEGKLNAGSASYTSSDPDGYVMMLN